MMTMNATDSATPGVHEPLLTGDRLAEDVLRDLRFYYTPLIVVLGTCGNVAAMMVLCLTKLRGQSSSYYLLALVASDTGFLLAQLVAWLERVGVPLFVQPVVCQLTQYTGSCCSFLSAWLVVAFTVERFVAVCYPLHRTSFCTAHRAKLLVVGLTAAAAAANSYMLVITRPMVAGRARRVVCDVDAARFSAVAFWLMGADVLVTLVLPFVLIVALNVRIARAVCRVQVVRRTMHVSAGANGAPRANGQQITKMLLVVSSMFLLLNLPFYAVRVWAFLAELANWSPPPGSEALQIVAHTMFELNFAINFLLYCVSGQNFRRAVRSLCCSERRTASARTGSTLAEHIQLTSPCGRSVNTGFSTDTKRIKLGGSSL